MDHFDFLFQIAAHAVHCTLKLDVHSYQISIVRTLDLLSAFLFLLKVFEVVSLYGSINVQLQYSFKRKYVRPSASMPTLDTLF